MGLIPTLTTDEKAMFYLPGGSLGGLPLLPHHWLKSEILMAGKTKIIRKNYYLFWDLCQGKMARCCTMITVNCLVPASSLKWLYIKL